MEGIEFNVKNLNKSKYKCKIKKMIKFVKYKNSIKKNVTKRLNYPSRRKWSRDKINEKMNRMIQISQPN